MVRVGIGVGSGQLRGEHLELRLRRLYRHPRSEASHHVSKPSPPLPRIWRDRQPRFGAAPQRYLHRGELGSHHADDHRRLTPSQTHGRSNDVTATAKLPLPELIAQNERDGRGGFRGRSRGGRDGVGRRKQPAKDWRPGKDLEEAVGDGHRDNLFGVARANQRDRPSADQGHRIDRAKSTCPVEVICRRNGAQPDVWRGLELEDAHQALAVVYRQASQQHRVHDTEYGRIEANGGSNRQHGCGGKRGTTTEYAEGVSSVSSEDIEVLHRRPASEVHSRAPPHAEYGRTTACARRILLLIAKVGGHVISEVAAKLRWKDAETRAKQSLMPR